MKSEAFVPGLGENLNIYTASNLEYLSTESVSSKSLSVSPGNPTIISVDKPQLGIISLILSAI